MANDDAPLSQPTPESQSPRRNRVRNQTRRDSILRGLRAGGLLATAMAGAWAWWQAWRNPGMLGPHGSGLDPLSLSFILLLAAATVWAFYACIVEPADSPRPRRTLLLAALLVLIPSTIAVVLLGRYWWQRSQAIGLPYPVLSQLAVVSAGIGVTVTAGLLLHLERGSRTPSKQLLRRRPTRTTTAVAVLTIAVATAALALPANTFQPRSTQVTATEAEPIPEILGNHVLWQHVFNGDETDVRGIISGTAGPIAITNHGAQGLDPHTGETTWSYTRPAHTSVFNRMYDTSCQGAEQAACHAVLTPDRSTLIVRYDAGPSNALLVALDTMTGEVRFEHMYHFVGDNRFSWDRGPNVQVTDNVLVIDQEILSITDGSHMGSLPRTDLPDCPGDSSCSNYDLDSEWVFSPFFQGGHSTLILGATCRYYDASGFETWCELILAPDSDPAATMNVSGIVPSDSSIATRGPTVVDGWTVRYRDPEVAGQELDREQKQGRLKEDALANLDLPIEVVSLDALSGTDTDQQPVPLAYPGRPMANRATRTLGISGTENVGERYQHPVLSDVFNPVDAQVYPIEELTEQATGLGYLDTLAVTQPNDVRGTGLSGWKSLDVLNPDGSVALHLDYEDITDPADIAAADGTLAYYHDGYLVPAPGVVALVYDRAVLQDNDDGANNFTARQTVVVGLG
ncbi:hypothetical protein [Actinomyces glycerinitolerans]|nr:hypothetical protein [Actinomyces glycerinitolerans]